MSHAIIAIIARFVLGKALEAGLQPIVVLNKADRPTARLDGALESELFDLFVALGDLSSLSSSSVLIGPHRSSSTSLSSSSSSLS